MTEKAGKTKQIKIALPQVHWFAIINYMIHPKALLGCWDFGLGWIWTSLQRCLGRVVLTLQSLCGWDFSLGILQALRCGQRAQAAQAAHSCMLPPHLFYGCCQKNCCFCFDIKSLLILILPVQEWLTKMLMIPGHMIPGHKLICGFYRKCNSWGDKIPEVNNCAKHMSLYLVFVWDRFADLIFYTIYNITVFLTTTYSEGLFLASSPLWTRHSGEDASEVLCNSQCALWSWGILGMS